MEFFIFCAVHPKAFMLSSKNNGKYSKKCLKKQDFCFCKII